jgi:hypothetical protein
MRGDYGEDMANLFKPSSHHHDTRQRLFNKPLRRTDRGQRGFAYAAPSILNNFAHIVDKHPEKKNFAAAIKKTLFGAK